jgi:hypothetical protein
MNNKLPQQQVMNKPKILVNGCSQSQAIVTDVAENDMGYFSWPTLLSNMLNCNLINLATNGKDNLTILTETQRYLLNYSDIDQVIVQLTTNKRITFYKESASFKFIPKEPETQFDRLLENNSSNKSSIFYKKTEVPRTIWMIHKGEKKEYRIGDASLFYHKLDTALQLFNLNLYCIHNNIKLIVIPFDDVGNDEELQDNVFMKIPHNIFLHNNIQIGLGEHLDALFSNFGGHFGKIAHHYLAKKISDYIQTGNQIEIDQDLINRNKFKSFIYDYT